MRAITNLSDVLRRRLCFQQTAPHVVWLTFASQCFQIARVAKFPTSFSFYSCVAMDRNPAFTVQATAHAFRAAINLNSMLLRQQNWCLGNYLIFDGLTWCSQKRIFIFGALGYFKFGALLDGLGRLISCKLALHVLVRYTEQFVLIHKHVTSFRISSISGTKTATMEPTKKASVKLSDHTPIIYLLSTSLASWNLKNWFRRFVPHIMCTNITTANSMPSPKTYI